MARRATHLFLSLVVVYAVIVAGAASGGALVTAGERAVQKSGSCSGPTDWRLSVRVGDPGKLVVVFSGQGGASGQKWNVFMDDNGSGFFQGSRTSGTGGSFRARGVTRNRAGTDKIVVRATNVPTGEICAANARY